MNGLCMVLPCPSCRRRLRVPTDRGELILKCPVCRTRWDWPPRSEEVRFIDDDVFFIDDEVLFIGDEPPIGDQGQSRSGDWSSGGLWDDWLDGPRPRERPGTVILPCPNCRRLLRVPTDRGELVLTCPICRTCWDWSPSGGHEPPLGHSWVRRACQVLLRRRA